MMIFQWKTLFWKIMTPICDVERWAFEQGFAACLELLGNSLLRRKEHEQDKS